MNQAHWAVMPLEAVCVPSGLVRGPFGGSLKKIDFVASGYRVYEQRHAINGTLDGARYFVDAKKFQEMKRFSVRPGDFIVSCSGTIGRIYQLPKSSPEGIINQALLKVTVDTRIIELQFFTSYFEWDRFQEKILESTQGGAMQNLVGMATFRKVPFIVPPIQEQRRIAEALRDSSELIGVLERLIAKKQAIKLGMMQQLLTGKTRRPGFAAPWAPTVIGSLGTLLKGRGVRRADVRTSGVPCIRYGELYTTFHNYTDGTVSFVSEDVAATALPIEEGDLLFAGSGETKAEIGTCVAYVGQSAAVAGGDIVVLRAPKVNAVFLASLLNTPEVAAMKASSGQGDAVVHINARAIGALRVELPERPEQDAIARVIIDADQELAALNARLDAVRNIKKGMMQELLTGRTRLKTVEAAA